MAGPAREVRELGQRGELEGVIRRQGEVGAHAAVGEEHGAAVQVVEAVRRRGGSPPAAAAAAAAEDGRRWPTTRRGCARQGQEEADAAWGRRP